MDSIMLLTVFVSFLVCLIGLKYWIKRGLDVKLVWEDMNKFGKPKNVVGSGGIIVLLGFLLGVMSYLAIRTFSSGRVDAISLQVFSLIVCVLTAGLIGLIDDFLGWHKGGLSARVRLFLIFLAAIPLMVINVGDSNIAVPFFGNINFGILYPLLLVPIGIIGSTTVYNFLAGFNGLEAGLGIIVVGFLSYVAFASGSPWLAVIGLCMVFALIAFWIYNKNPAKVFPGDVLTYSVGALIGAMAIVGNFEKIALIVFIPFIIEMILKIRGGMNPPRKQSFGIPQRDGSLKLPYKKIYGLTHFSIWFLSKFKKKVYENDVVYLIYIIQIIFVLIGLWMV